MSGITGIDRLRKDATIFRQALGEEVARELQASVDKPIGKFRRTVDTAIEVDFPKRYAGVFGGAFRIKVSATSGAATLRIKLVGTAKGKANIRDSAALNRGVLRHKRWGKLPWYSQPVRPGFWDEPGKALAGDVQDAVEEAVEKASKTVEGQL